MNASAPPARRPFRARLARYVLIAVAGFLILCGVSALAVPMVIDHLVLGRVGQSIGRQVTIERIRFNPFTLTLTARGIRVAEQDAAADFVTVDEVFADLSISSVRYLAPVIDALRIVGPRVNLQRTEAQRFNFSDIVDRLAAAPVESRPQGEPTRFALHNLELTGGEIRLEDRVLDQDHRVSDLQIGIPFISNLDYATTMTVQPALSAQVNGSPLSLAGTSLPFSATRETTLDVVLKDLDIATYLRLSPVALGFTIPKGRLSTDLQIRFAQEGGTNKLAISGSSQIDDLQIDAREGPRLVLAKRVALGLARVEPLESRYAFDALDVEGLDIDIIRRRDGALPLVQAFARAASDNAPSTAKKASAEWSIRKTTLRGGVVGFRDETVEPAVVLNHTEIGIDLAEIGNRQARPAAASLSLKQNQANSLSWRGTVDMARARAAGKLDARVTGIEPYLPYLGTVLAARLESGALAAKGDLDMGWAGDFTLAVADGEASAENAALTLPDEKQPAVAVGRLAVEGVTVSLAGRTVQVDRAEVSDARLQVERDAKGSLNLQRLAAADAARPAPGAGAAAANASWKVTVRDVDLDGNEVAWRDLGTPKPVSIPITQLAGSVGPVGTDLSARIGVDLKARIGSAGMLAARGDLAVDPWSLDLAVQLQRLALSAFDPYLAERLALGIDEGALATTGKLRLGDGRVAYNGRLEVDGLRSRERTSSTETIRWRKLLLDGIDLDVEPAVLGPKDRIAIGAITLSDFFARVVLSEDGRFNLQDIVHSEASAQARARAAARAKTGASKARDGKPASTNAEEGAPPAAAQPSPGRNATAKAAPASAASAARTDAKQGPAIRLGAIKLEQGRSNFTDRFVKPNYSVNLTELNGGLSAMASDSQQPADLNLTGRVDGNAPVDISGKLNPLGPTLYTDIRAKASGIDLPTLTPYSAKYAGYTIEKGKLSLDVHYRIENEQLEAQNRVVLDQLTFGEKVESPEATTLPIQFALGLLKNSDGEIDVNLPIAGSLDDPQFSIGSVIGKAIANLLTRVVTAPFTALASAFGGGKEELSFVEFEPGSASLTQESIKRLQIMSKALLERPALKLEIAGRVDPKAEKDAIARQRLEARLKALKRRETGAADGARTAAGPAPAEKDGQQERQPDGADQQSQARQAQARQEEAAVAAGVTLTPAEYPALLRKLYDDTELADKPRNALGVPRRIEVPEMEKLLLGAIETEGEVARRLATRRAQAVRRWLASQGKVPEDRMFMLAPRTSPTTTGPNQSKPQCSASCAEFSLR